MFTLLIMLINRDLGNFRSIGFLVLRFWCFPGPRLAIQIKIYTLFPNFIPHGSFSLALSCTREPQRLHTTHDLFLLEAPSPATFIGNNETVRAMKIVLTLAVVNAFPTTDILKEEVPEVHWGVGCRPVKAGDVSQSSLEQPFCEVDWNSWGNAVLQR